jgi:peptidoglycan-N-acetylglucosamine deacetylase
VERREFLLRAALLGAGAVAGAAGAAGVEEYRRGVAGQAGRAVGGDVPRALSAEVTYRVATDEPVLALTFDDGPSAEHTHRVLDVLDRKDVTATFFVVGSRLHRGASVLRRAAERHEIGNHTFDHVDLAAASARTVRSQLTRTHDEVARLTGVAPTLLRPPYGRFGGATVLQAAGLGYSIVLWSDRVHARGESARANAARLGARCGPGSVVLAHDGGPLPGQVVVDALPDLIDRWHARHLRLVTVSELLSVGRR